MYCSLFITKNSIKNKHKDFDLDIVSLTKLHVQKLNI